jgi:hypothetical protein
MVVFEAIYKSYSGEQYANLGKAFSIFIVRQAEHLEAYDIREYFPLAAAVFTAVFFIFSFQFF